MLYLDALQYVYILPPINSKKMPGISELIKKNIIRYENKKLDYTNSEKICNFLETVDGIMDSNQDRIVIKLPDFDDVLSALCLANILANLDECTVISKRKSTVVHLLNKTSAFATYYDIFIRNSKVKIYKNFKDAFKEEKNIVIFGLPSDKIFIENLHTQHAGRKIVILTGVDTLDNHEDVTNCIDALKNAGWKILNFDLPWHISKEINLRIVRIHTNHFTDLYKLKSNFYKDYRKYIIKAENFYLRVPVPLKDYSQFVNTLHTLTRFLVNLPSREIGMLASIKDDSGLKKLAEKLSEFEKKTMWHTNPKYEVIMKIIDGAYRRDNKVPLVFPNRTFSEVFRKSILENPELHSSAGESVLTLHRKMLTREKRFFKALLLTSLPTPEFLLQASLCSEELILPAYSLELKYLDRILKLVNQSDYFRTKYGLNVTLKVNKKIINFDYDKSGSQEFKSHTTDMSLLFEDYISFEKLIESSDDCVSYTKRSSIDTSTYIIKTKDGDEITVKGYRKILRRVSKTIFKENSLEWVTPGELISGDTVIWLDCSLLRALMKKELENLLAEDTDHEALQLSIDLISMWKRYLRNVSEKYENIAEIHRILQKNGLRRCYTTVKHWFSGLSSDPVESVIEAILNPEINIGPQSKEDIDVFARSFGFDDIQKCSEYIYNAMEIFRTLNRRTGKFIRRKIISMILSGELEGKYKVLKVKDIVRVVDDD